MKISNLEFTVSREIGGGAVALDFQPVRPIRFRAGQHGLWAVPRGGVTPFTMASAPEEDVVTLATSLTSGSRTKRALAGLRPGARVRLVGPLSGFTFPEQAPAVVMLAQGIGITPFRAMLAHAELTGSAVPTSLVHVAPEHAYRGDTEAWAGEAFYPTSRTDFGDILADVTARRTDAMYMISGTRDFVTTTANALDGLGVIGHNVRRDVFYGWSNRPAQPTPQSVLAPVGDQEHPSSATAAADRCCHRSADSSSA
jgi:ferredoxin-NADP reductase